MERAELEQKPKEAGTVESSSHVGDETLEWKDINPWCCGPRTVLDLDDLPNSTLCKAHLYYES